MGAQGSSILEMNIAGEANSHKSCRYGPSYGQRTAIGLTSNDDRRRFEERKEQDNSNPTSPTRSPPRRTEDVPVLFQELQLAASTCFELLDPLSMLQEWHKQGPSPSHKYNRAAYEASTDTDPIFSR